MAQWRLWPRQTNAARARLRPGRRLYQRSRWNFAGQRRVTSTRWTIDATEPSAVVPIAMMLVTPAERACTCPRESTDALDSLREIQCAPVRPRLVKLGILPSLSEPPTLILIPAATTAGRTLVRPPELLSPAPLPVVSVDDVCPVVSAGGVGTMISLDVPGSDKLLRASSARTRYIRRVPRAKPVSASV